MFMKVNKAEVSTDYHISNTTNTMVPRGEYLFMSH